MKRLATLLLLSSFMLNVYAQVKPDSADLQSPNPSPSSEPLPSPSEPLPPLESLPPAPPPPPMPKEEDMPVEQDQSKPEVSITKKGENTVEEYRIRGKLYMVKVIPPIGKPYYLVDRDGSGNLTRLPNGTKVTLPMWLLHSW